MHEILLQVGFRAQQAKIYRAHSLGVFHLQLRFDPIAHGAPRETDAFQRGIYGQRSPPADFCLP